MVAAGRSRYVAVGQSNKETSMTYEGQESWLSSPDSIDRSDARCGKTAHRTAKFWDRHADAYAKKPVPNEAVYRAKLEQTGKHLRPDARVFEFGCGTGSTALMHAPYVEHILATDVSARMIEIAQAKAKAAGVENVRFQVGSIETLAADAQSFDAVLGLSILHLVEDRTATIGKVFELLKPGGVFVSSTVCLGDRMGWFRWVGPPGAFLGLIPPVAVFTVAELQEGLTEAGFELDHVWVPEGSHSVFIVARKPA
jgi:2-polyprenyl-3-methyl-5-hydroxy-6-metoxy-1,4-benzoquinol methylase